MEKIKLRDFQRQLYAIATQEKDFEVINSGGVTIGYWTKKVETVLHASQEPEVIVSMNKCLKCKNPATVFGEIWEDGEAHGVYLCALHLASIPNKKTFKEL
jgi:hypothetical protein